MLGIVGKGVDVFSRDAISGQEAMLLITLDIQGLEWVRLGGSPS